MKIVYQNQKYNQLVVCENSSDDLTIGEIVVILKVLLKQAGYVEQTISETFNTNKKGEVHHEPHKRKIKPTNFRFERG